MLPTPVLLKRSYTNLLYQSQFPAQHYALAFNYDNLSNALVLCCVALALPLSLSLEHWILFVPDLRSLAIFVIIKTRMTGNRIQKKVHIALDIVTMLHGYLCCFCIFCSFFSHFIFCLAFLQPLSCFTLETSFMNTIQHHHSGKCVCSR